VAFEPPGGDRQTSNKANKSFDIFKKTGYNQMVGGLLGYNK
jgi:hypothetical protein